MVGVFGVSIVNQLSRFQFDPSFTVTADHENVSWLEKGRRKRRRKKKGKVKRKIERSQRKAERERKRGVTIGLLNF